MTEQTVRIGVIGAGANTREKHLPNLQAIKGVEVLAVCNRRPESTAAVARDFGIPRACDDWREIVDMPDVDAVVIGTWPYLHCEATCAAFAAGKHVLCEARMARDASEAHRMLAARDEAGLVGQIVPSPLGLNVHRAMPRLISEYVGTLYEIHADSLAGSCLDAGRPLHWREDRTLSGLNTLSLGIVYEAVQRWFGPASSVMASTQVVITHRQDADSGHRQPISVPDSVSVLAEMACGARAVYRLSGVTHCPPEPSIAVYGSRGSLHYCVNTGEVHAARLNEEEPCVVDIPADETYEWSVESEFIDSIRHGTPVELTSFEDGVAYMEFTEAVHRSAEEQVAVRLPL